MKINALIDSNTMNHWRQKDTDLFPRGQHPDKRTAKEWFADMGINVIEKKLLSGDAVWYPKSFSRGSKSPVRCLNDGKEFISMAQAERFYGLPASAIGKIHGKIRSIKRRGLKFEVLE